MSHQARAAKKKAAPDASLGLRRTENGAVKIPDRRMTSPTNIMIFGTVGRPLKMPMNPRKSFIPNCSAIVAPHSNYFSHDPMTSIGQPISSVNCNESAWPSNLKDVMRSRLFPHSMMASLEMKRGMIRSAFLGS